MDLHTHTQMVVVPHVSRTMTIIHSRNILLDNIYVNSTDTQRAVGFDFSSLNVRNPLPL